MALTVQPADVLDAYEADDGIELRPLVSSDDLMVVRVDIAPGATLRIHDHPHEQAGYVAEGAFTFTGDETREVEKGDGYYVPPGHKHGVEGGEEPAVAIDVFTPARASYRELFDHL
ncbi:cupin domain-containing protein [Haladaptatus sp. YSMS36]|uniref:cupin domain-containing protein n=1 Tax=Haladaptatus sp. YSMS36 TaxID=3033384 RepID=UPI0023E849F8|nr:cupin domain-containing protein [Haladaptatus sp. YSMS36]